MGGVAPGRASRSCDNSFVAVFVRELRDDFGLRLAAARAGKGLHAVLRLGGRLRHLAAVPRMAKCIGVSIHIAVAAGAGMSGIALGRAGRSRNNILVAVLVRQIWDVHALFRTAKCASIRHNTVCVLCGFLRHFTCIPAMDMRGSVSIMHDCILK